MALPTLSQPNPVVATQIPANLKPSNTPIKATSPTPTSTINPGNVSNFMSHDVAPAPVQPVAITQPTSNNFSVPPSNNTYTSSQLSRSNSLADIQAKLQQLSQTISSGDYSNPALKTTDAFTKQYLDNYAKQYIADNGYSNRTNGNQDRAEAMRQAGLMSDEEMAQRQALADANTAIEKQKVQTRNQIANLYTNGAITREQAQAMGQEAERRANQESQDLSLKQLAAANSVNALEAVRTANFNAAKSYYEAGKPVEVSPGGVQYSPFGGVQYQAPYQVSPGNTVVDQNGNPIYQGAGASPQQIVSTAQQLKQNDQTTGQLRLDASGNIDENYYYQQAQQLYSTQGRGTGGQYGSVSSMGGQQQIPQQLLTYLNASGGSFISEDKVPANQQALVKQLAAQNNIPYLNSGDVRAVRDIQYVKQTVGQLDGVVSNILSSGLTGRARGVLLNPIKQFFQTDTDITSFNSYRDTAIKVIQSLAGGEGSGLRLNAAEIATATSNIPTINDNLETAQKKINVLNTFLDFKLKTIFPNQTTGYGGQVGGQSTGNSIYDF